MYENQNLKATVDAKRFTEALTRAGRALAKSTTTTTSNAYLRFGDGRCVVMGANLERRLQIEIPATGDSIEFLLYDTAALLRACK
jgi:hypothetical protein